ncbi:MAG TPA: NADH-quinone oxidoreductase subunit NuoF [Anaerolineae bacterium]|nr:NADH-quinone oxidoreductase subunit NuoF [Anaerolineae bacterium]
MGSQPTWKPQRRVLLRNVGVPRGTEIETYVQRGGYRGLEKALREHEPREVVEMVLNSGLRGRGGAGFPTGRKWMFLPKGVYPRYLVCNADEGEPGTFKDRVLIEEDPHGLIEGITVSSYACEAAHAFIYIRGEYDLGRRRLEQAIQEAYEWGFLGKNIRDSGYNLEMSVISGAGAYICGEETSLLSSLEGKRGHPKLKPPFPASQGLYRLPTIVNNVETLANVPLIVLNGAEWYRQWGTEMSPGLKLFSVSGHVERPGVYELPLGTPMRELIEDVCGGPKDGIPLKAIIPGGSSVPMLPADVAMETTLDYESLSQAGSSLGSGGVIVANEQTCIVRLTKRLASFYRHESCGKCIPCREGTDWMYKILTRIEAGHGRLEDLPLLLDISSNIAGRSFCPLGDAAIGPVVSSIQRFRDEYEFHIAEGRCPAGTQIPQPHQIHSVEEPGRGEPETEESSLLSREA